MTISGFTFVRNATKYYFPIKESIASILPIVDEFIVALGIGDEDDRTEEEIASLGSDKIKIYRRTWDEKMFHDGEIYRFETSFALSQCTGDWCFYLQADEVVHEKDLPLIHAICEKYLDSKAIDGFLFRYFHFWGDYNHQVDSFHGWYNREIRIVRNFVGIESYKDAQSFRKDQNSKKLNVIEIPAYIYHYGWVRPPEVMPAKKKEQDSAHWGKEAIEERFKNFPDQFDYGAIGKIPLFAGTHPAVMNEWISRHNWKDTLNYSKVFTDPGRPLHKHEKKKYRRLTFIEKTFFGGKRLFGYKNWKVAGNEKKPF